MKKKSSMRRHENERRNGDGIYNDSMTVFEKKKKEHKWKFKNRQL